MSAKQHTTDKGQRTKRGQTKPARKGVECCSNASCRLCTHPVPPQPPKSPCRTKGTVGEKTQKDRIMKNSRLSLERVPGIFSQVCGPVGHKKKKKKRTNKMKRKPVSKTISSKAKFHFSISPTQPVVWYRHFPFFLHFFLHPLFARGLSTQPLLVLFFSIPPFDPLLLFAHARGTQHGYRLAIFIYYPRCETEHIYGEVAKM